jgi:uncharacterized membrane protein YecN with MAPEG domain
MLTITAFYASILAFIYMKLSLNIISLRRKYKISLGFGKHKDLEQAIRAHANFNETVPIGLILLVCLEVNKIHFLIVLILGGLLILGRYFHAKAFLKDTIDLDGRVLGIKCTFWSIRLMAAMNIFAIIVKLI